MKLTKQRLYGVHIGSFEMRWILADSKEQALKIAMSDCKDPEYVADYDSKIALKPNEFREVKRNAEVKLKRKYQVN